MRLKIAPKVMAYACLFFNCLTASAEENIAYLECMLTEMKGQAAEMRGLVHRLCAKRTGKLTKKQVIANGRMVIGSDGQYLIDRLSWSAYEYGKKSLVIVSYEPLPSAPELSTVDLKVSSKECGSNAMNWKTVSFSARRVDVESYLNYFEFFSALNANVVAEKGDPIPVPVGTLFGLHDSEQLRDIVVGKVISSVDGDGIIRCGFYSHATFLTK